MLVLQAKQKTVFIYRFHLRIDFGQKFKNFMRRYKHRFAGRTEKTIAIE